MIRAAALVNSSRVRFHALLSYPRPVPGMRVAPLAVQGPAACLYRNLCRQAHGPGRQYLYKPLLHWVLAADVRRVIVLDTDVVVLRDISELWAEFGRFGDAMIGVANEQSNLYSGDAIGKNGGVQLLDLAKMRASQRYAEALDRYASGAAGKYIGYLGDQTLYSWMSVNGSGAQHIFHVLPCGWNRQIGTHMAGWKGFWAAHACDAPCHLLHGNFVEHKRFMESLKRDSSGGTCRKVVADHRARDRLFRSGTPDARMLDMVQRKCCRSR